MNNSIAAPRCGSCKYWNVNEFCSEHDVYTEASQFSCEGEDYSPRNPISIISLPGVKELIEKAYRAGAENKQAWLHGKINDAVNDYMKALEDGDK